MERIDVGPKGAVISFHQNHFAAPDALIAFVSRRISTLKIRPDQKLFYSHEWAGAADIIASLKKLTGEIAALAVP
jgi:transcription-repair coupling factor (superfamily II helicase)